MVYIDRDGSVLQRRPWSVSRVLEIFTGLWFISITLGLLSPFMKDEHSSSGGNSRRGGWGGGYGGGGGGGGGGGYGGGGGGGGGGGSGGGGGGGSGGGGSFGPNRRIGRINNTSMDAPSCGSCCG